MAQISQLFHVRRQQQQLLDWAHEFSHTAGVVVEATTLSGYEFDGSLDRSGLQQISKHPGNKKISLTHGCYGFP